MKINYMSDCHLEFGDLELPGGDVLVMAGDMMVADMFRANRTDKTAEKASYRFRRFLREEMAKYRKVLYIAGNHEHYHGCFDETHALLRKEMPENVTFLDNEVATIDGVTFFGGTFWTDMNRRDPHTLMEVRRSMNDFRIIEKEMENGRRRNFIPEDAADAFDVSVAALAKAYADWEGSGKFVVISHHAPSVLSIDPAYKNSHRMNGAYFSHLEEFIMDRPGIDTWFHGHMHIAVDYKVGENTRVISNPRGYHNYEPQAASFDPTRFVEI